MTEEEKALETIDIITKLTVKQFQEFQAGQKVIARTLSMSQTDVCLRSASFLRRLADMIEVVEGNLK